MLHNPKLLGIEEKICFGTLENNSNFYLSNHEVANVITKIIAYTLLRVELLTLEK